MAVAALINGASFVALLGLGILVLTENRAKPESRLFAGWCFVTGWVALLELLGRFTETYSRAVALSQLAAIWPLASALFVHFALVASTNRTRYRAAAIVAGYAIAATMATAYFVYARGGNAVEPLYGYSFTSAVGTDWPSIAIVVGQPILMLGAIGLLARSAILGTGTLGKRELWWLLAAYGAAVVLTLAIGFLRARTSLAIPEQTGPTYLVFCLLLLVPLRRGLLTSLTPRSALETTLRASLAEKEALLREVHHRVNNSLQLIISLLNLKSESIADARARRMVEGSIDRIHLISRVYERAYAAENLTAIRLDEYVRETAEEFAVRAERPGVTLRFDLDRVAIDMQTSIVLGMIVAELLSNVFDHAFPHDTSGTVHLSLKRDIGPRRSPRAAQYCLIVGDDGCGWDPVRQPERTGLQLARALAEQIEADLSVETSNGVTAHIVFSVAVDHTA